MKDNPDIRLAHANILTINGGSSSIKFATFEPSNLFQRILEGPIDRIGKPEATLHLKNHKHKDTFSQSVKAPDHKSAIAILMECIEKQIDHTALMAIGHRLVQGGPKYSKPQRIDSEMVKELRKFSSFDPEHLPQEILLVEAFHHHFPTVSQVACFDTAFHRDLPSVAKILPIPRRYEKQGIRRYGFHGLSYEFLMEELARKSSPEAARGRIILAHLGNGASLAAVQGGKSIDTSMSFTPSSGIPMSTRSGDLDPGLSWFLDCSEQLDARGFNKMVNFQSGLLGISETSSDMRDLLKIEKQDQRAAEAIEVFCYQIKKWIGAFAAALGGLDTLIFSGGIGENVPTVRSRICANLEFLGLAIDEKQNKNNMGLISSADSRTDVRVMHTDEEMIIAKTVCNVLNIQR